ncbi:MAG: transglutaminase domain-containing protein [Planctomycetes bacterium]|nr:transglutaminase domain-containing protein [Planctomycetota bacterium]
MKSVTPCMIAAAMAAEIAGNEKNSWRVAQRIERWVEQNMAYRLQLKPVTAASIMSTLQGDCTEYALWTVGLARASGIPSKLCTGPVAIGRM